MKRVLFLCNGNSCRSQMAEALWREHSAGEWEAYSAGSAATGFVHPLTIEVLEELGLDCSDARSKPVAEFEGSPFDLIVTVCGEGKEESCDVGPGGGDMAHWPFDDPAESKGTEEQLRRVFRRVRDEIQAKILCYLKQDYEAGLARGGDSPPSRDLSTEECIDGDFST